MTFWKEFYQGIEGWTTLEHALSQHKTLLETGGTPCKVLFKNQSGLEIGAPEDPLVVATWDDSTSSSPKKIVWQDGDDITNYPDPTTIQVFVDDVELTPTFSYETISSDSEFYVEVIENSVDEVDKVAFYLNLAFDTAGKVISYCYKTRGKNVSNINLQPKEDTVNYRSTHGFTQYISTSSKYRGSSVPNTIVISFPPPPAIDSRYSNVGVFEEWKNRGWALGDIQLHENDIVYRVSDGRWYEITDWEPNYYNYKGEWKLLTQSFTLVQLGPTDIIRQFPLV